MTKRVAVIGGGLGGLTAALRLARSGFEVQLFEKNESLGGKMNRVQSKGFRFDTGPSLLTMPFVIDELFHFLGADRKSMLDFRSIEPICRYFWQDGSQIDASMNYPDMMLSMERFSKRDAQNYKAFLDYSKTIYEITADVFLYAPVHEIGKIVNRHLLSKLMNIRKIDPFRTVHQGVRRFFDDPRIVQLFDRYATYNGSDPYQAPATLNIIPYVEYVLGSFYIKGGMYKLIEALQKLAVESGIPLHTNTAVEKIIYRNRRIRGIQVAGEQLDFDYVISNADVVVAHERLIDGFNRRRKKLQRLEPSLSGMVFLWGINRRFEQLKHHNIFFSGDYRNEFKQLFKEGALPDDPTIYAAITSKSDAEDAPDGMENWFVLLNMPYIQNSDDRNSHKNQLKEMIINKLKRFQIDIEQNIIFEHGYTAKDFYDLYGSNRGSIYGISSNSRMTAFRRPPNRSRQIKGLYFVGGSTHPGGGIPLVMLSAKMVSDMILEKERN